MDCSDDDGCGVGSSDKDDAAANLGFGSSKPGCQDKEGNPMMTIVDRSGIHEIGIGWCHCPEAPEHDIQLMMAGLFMATFHNPKTAFTFRVLEEFHLDNLECKTTPSQFFSCLRRLTNDEFPNTVPVGEFNVSGIDGLTSRRRIDTGSF
jgi:CxC2 like cysteine cluster associated with KDZ transposases